MMPRGVRLPLIALAVVVIAAVVLGFWRVWPVALFGSCALGWALWGLVQHAYWSGYAAHDHDVRFVRRNVPRCTWRDVARYERRLRASRNPWAGRN